MLLINCGRKGGPFQTPKIPRKHIIKAAVVQPAPPVSLPRLGVEGKNSSCSPQVTLSQVGMSGGQALSVSWETGVSGTWLESGYSSWLA